MAPPLPTVTFHLRALWRTTVTAQVTLRPRPFLSPSLPPPPARNATLARNAKRRFRAHMIANDTTTHTTPSYQHSTDASTAAKTSAERIHSNVIWIMAARRSPKKSRAYRAFYSFVLFTLSSPLPYGRFRFTGMQYSVLVSVDLQTSLTLYLIYPRIIHPSLQPYPSFHLLS